MSELTLQEIHARLTETSNQLSRQWLGNWQDEVTMVHIELGFQKTLEDLDLLPVVISHNDETHMFLAFKVKGEWVEFPIEYATGKVGEWIPDED